MQPLQICIGPTIRIGQESWCLPYAGFFYLSFTKGLNNLSKAQLPRFNHLDVKAISRFWRKITK